MGTILFILFILTVVFLLYAFVYFAFPIGDGGDSPYKFREVEKRK